MFLLLSICISSFSLSPSKKKGAEEPKDTTKNNIYEGLKFRNIGPAFTSGRIADFAVNPSNHSEYYVAVASGNVWKTENNGTTYFPVFEQYGAYSIGCVAMDPNNHNHVWIGTGENNHQRALGYGDGVYKSVDGGQSWKNMGLKDSRQIGGIVIDPRNSDVIFVAAEGSAWGPGGDRGLYKSTDGGVTWKKVLEISEQTGVNNIIMDPIDPDLLYATSEQRRRHVFTKIGGGPESTVYKSTDNGETWRKISTGLPSVDIGGMGIAISPVNHNYLYLIVEAAEGKSGFFRSTNRGESWERMSDYASSGQYYNEIYCDPNDLNVVYSVETFTQITEDGGKTWRTLGNDNRHVDDHALWIDPNDSKHLLIGGDGGIYESFDHGKLWVFKSNLPVTQFYRVQVDNDYPFYNVYGGTQDNNSFGGPSQNSSSAGVTSEEWFTLLGGDGFWVQIDPENPNIIYCESQYGNVVRYDKKTGEQLGIKPMPRKGEHTYKWNWDTPLLISPHSKTRLYIAANKVFRSDDRGDSWKVISEDITSQTDRNTWAVMDHYWSIDAVAKDVSTSLWGTAVAMDESPVKENLLYVGTDDGVISVTENAGESWRQVKSFPGAPDYSYVSDIMASKHDENTVYASLNNLKRDDFKPYVLKSTDKGRTWTSISSNLPINGTVHALQQDFINPDLLFAGTEFGVFFSKNGGKEWIQLKSGIPTIAIRDIAIQERESDLVLASFGRGFFILDDYSSLRELTSNEEIENKEAHIFNVSEALMYIQTGGKYGQGASLYHTPNPDFGAMITYYLKDVPKTLKQERQEKEKTLFKEKKPIPQLNYKEELKEKEEVDPYLIFTISDIDGNVLRKINQKASKGINRLNWDLRYDSPFPIRAKDKFNPTSNINGGFLALPGTYQVSMDIVARGERKNIAGPVEFEAKALDNATINVKDRSETLKFNKLMYDLAGDMRGSQELAESNLTKIISIKQTLSQSARADWGMMKEAEIIEQELRKILLAMKGPEAKASSEELPPMDVPLNDRLYDIVYGSWSTTYGITGTMKTNYGILLEAFPPVKEKLKSILTKIESLELKMNIAGVQWTEGRILKDL